MFKSGVACSLAALISEGPNWQSQCWLWEEHLALAIKPPPWDASPSSTPSPSLLVAGTSLSQGGTGRASPSSQGAPSAPSHGGFVAVPTRHLGMALREAPTNLSGFRASLRVLGNACGAGG